MKNWLKFAIGATTLAAFTAQAQTHDERQKMRPTTETQALLTLAEELQAKFDADEIRVNQYLLDNPKQLRTEVKNGIVHYLVRIDDDGQPRFRINKAGVDTQKNRESGQLIKADSLYLGGSLGVNITGTGMVAGVWEIDAVRQTHELFAGKAINQPGQFPTTGDGNHAAHVTGTMIGVDLATRPTARGIAFGASSQNYTAPNDLAEMAAFAANGFLISNHSYGDANTQTANLWRYGAYDGEAKGWDGVTKNAPFYLPFVAGGNEQTTSGNVIPKAGYDIMTGSSAAKNVMTVGAVNGDKTMSDYSNWGPTDDGRVKPEIVARGTGIDSAQASTPPPNSVGCDNCYSGSGADASGTSYATPAAAAAALLLQQYYKSLHGAFMLSSTLKALMMGTAEDLGAPGPDHKFGWGLLNVENAALAIKKRSPLAATLATSKGSYIEEIATNPAADSTAEITRDVFAKGGVPLVVNIGWVDDDGPVQLAGEGIDPTTTRLVYDFDMMVRQVAPNPVVDTWPWVVPGMANRTANATVATAWFQSNGGNFRQIIIAAPIANAKYTVTLRKKTGSPALDRSVSLVVTGLVEAVPGAPVNAVCGSANSTPSLVAPSANLCGAGTATAVTSGTNSFTWSCNGDNGGTNASCTAPRQYVVTATAGANGTLTCTNPVVGGNTTNCIANPATGFNTQSISGCNGTATGLEVNNYVTGAVTVNCTVTAAFVAAAPTDGHCGSANAVASLAAPNANLCGVGTASAVASGVSSFTWSCVGTTATATCAAPRQYTVTASAGANGTLNCASPVTAGNTTTCTATPSGGFTTQSISGCSGVATNAGINSYSTGALIVDCTVSAAFAAVVVPGSCGAYVGGTTCNLDADGNGLFEPRDAQLIARRLAGLSDAALTDGLTAPLACATRPTGASVATFVDARTSGAALPKPYDIDGDGQVHATTDGLMILRVALGLTGDAVVLNATAAGAPRTTWAQVRPYLVTNCGLTVGP